MKSSSEIRQTFLDYFKNNGHEVVASSPLVPANDPTLLFTNAGMVQFKDVFLGNDKRSYNRAVTSQCCVRAGGKHNDLENVGYTARHHTFFEMLGNFSFGDYFKKEAIEYSWELLTRIYKVPEDKLWVTVYTDDEEAANIWLNDIGIDPSRFSRCGEKDNFWSMGDTGPCGPCSEIFYDHGTDIPGGPPGSSEAEGDRFVEIWNLVFTQFDRNTEGELIPIPHPSVDTGMGLERITAVLQGVHNNYEIDIFVNLINAIRKMSGSKDLDLISSRVVADHIRSCAFLVADGVLPSNEGRGYVLRRIIRRAVRHGNKLGFKQPFFYKLVKALGDEMGDTYPELENNRINIEKILLNEEQRFAETLEQGLKVLDEVIAKLDSRTIAGKDVFRLYDTYGFPVDLTADIARESDLEVDMQGFHQAMAEQRQRARAASKFDMGMTVNTDDNLVSEFSGYERLQQKSTIIALYQDGRKVQSLNQGDVGGVIMLETPFYAQSGGQVGDKGDLTASGIFFEVEDTKKQGQSHIHLGVLRTGSIKVGDALIASVDQARRMHIMRNHSATHLLHAALRVVLGDHVIQKGSLVAPDRLRFDFSHPDPLTENEIQGIERLINRKILENVETDIEIMSLDDALKSGAMSLFGEKYEESVRVLKIGREFSIELCGGTHVRYAGDIGLLKIISETGTAAGIRRIEAVTGEGALQWVEENQDKLNRVAQLIKADRDNVEHKLSQYIDRTRKLEKEIEQLKGQIASNAGEDMLTSALDIEGIKVIAKVLDGADPKTLRDTVDQLKNKLGTAALVLASVDEDKVSLIAGVTKDKTGIIKAGELVNFVAQKVGGKGGGRPDMAQAGGNDPDALPEALASVPEWIRQQLNQ